MKLITLTKEILEQEHICCAISNNKDCQVASKKAWLNARFDEGLVFTKGDVRGKCFIEYIPAEKAWAPIKADGWMYIDCLWVSGQFKGHGYSNELLQSCIDDSKAKGKKGLVCLSSKKKLAFIADPQYLKHKGFVTVDTASPSFELMCLSFNNTNPLPCFNQSVKTHQKNNNGFELYFSRQCPFTAKYIPVIEAYAQQNNLPLHIIEFTSAEQSQQSPTPFTTFSLFYNGDFITHEILNENKFEKILQQIDYK